MDTRSTLTVDIEASLAKAYDTALPPMEQEEIRQHLAFVLPQLKEPNALIAPVRAALSAMQSRPVPNPAPAPNTNLVEKWVNRLKRHPIIAFVIVLSLAVVGTGQVFDAIGKISDVWQKIPATRPELPALPGGSGWLLLGDLAPSGKYFVRGPFFSVTESRYPDKSLLPRKGELIRISAERNVIIPSYRSSGLRFQLMAPWKLNVLTDNDYTGVKLPKDSVVEVRDIALGSFPGNPVVVWVRVAPPPK